ncbi:MAG: sulfatase [Kiritimatiellaceae bacterium]|nr:MAG: sulfatase [Kiritimatiellaceae bacterium]
MRGWRVLWLGLLFVCCERGGCYAELREPARRPNILFIITDDQFRDQFGFLGGEALTPHIDSLANDGFFFENGFVSSSVCSPSRYTCLTGQYASRCELEDFTKWTSEEGVRRIVWNVGFVADQPNVPRILQQAGYATGFAGKWHLNEMRELIEPVAKGSDPADPEVRAILRRNHALYQRLLKPFGFDEVLAVYEGNPNDDPALVASGCNVHNQEWLTQAALTFIEEHREEPWFLYWAPTLMHVPNPMESLQGDPRKCGLGLLDEPIRGVQPSRASVLERTERAGIPEENRAATWLDDGVGAIRSALREMGLEKDTLIIYYNDHGMEDKAKGTCYVAGQRTQILACWPGVIEPWRPEAWIQNVDFAPTFFELAGAEPPANMPLDGRSLVPILRGETPEDWRREIYSEIGLTRAVTTPEWSYVAFRVPPSLQRTRAERYAEAKTYYAQMLEKHPWMEREFPLLEEAPYFQMGIVPGGYAFERWHIKATEEKPWVNSYFDRDQLFDLERDPRQSKNRAMDPACASTLSTMKLRLKGYVDRLPGTFPLEEGE